MIFLNKPTYSCRTSVIIVLLVFIETKSSLAIRAVIDDSTMSSVASLQKRTNIGCCASGPIMEVIQFVIRDEESVPDLSLRVSNSQGNLVMPICSSCQALTRPGHDKKCDQDSSSWASQCWQ